MFIYKVYLLIKRKREKKKKGGWTGKHFFFLASSSLSFLFFQLVEKAPHYRRRRTHSRHILPVPESQSTAPKKNFARKTHQETRVHLTPKSNTRSSCTCGSSHSQLIATPDRNTGLWRTWFSCSSRLLFSSRACVYSQATPEIHVIVNRARITALAFQQFQPFKIQYRISKWPIPKHDRLPHLEKSQHHRSTPHGAQKKKTHNKTWYPQTGETTSHKIHRNEIRSKDCKDCGLQKKKIPSKDFPDAIHKIPKLSLIPCIGWFWVSLNSKSYFTRGDFSSHL